MKNEDVKWKSCTGNWNFECVAYAAHDELFFRHMPLYCEHIFIIMAKATKNTSIKRHFWALLLTAFMSFGFCKYSCKACVCSFFSCGC